MARSLSVEISVFLCSSLPVIKVNNYKYFSIVLILLSILSFFIGYIYDENSAGGGPTDFIHTWANLHTFLNNPITLFLVQV